MAEVATRMMRKQIERADIPALEDIMEMTQLEGVKFAGWRMTLDMMGLKEVVVHTAEDHLKQCPKMHNKHVHVVGCLESFRAANADTPG